MSDILYAVHTKTCTYLLDEDGVCRWIVSPTGMVPPEVRRCLGAQFVASLDLRLPGGLAGELRIGAFGLFVARRDDDATKLVLLRTAAIQNVEFRDPADPFSFGTKAPGSTAAAPQIFVDGADSEVTGDLVSDEDNTSEIDPDDLVMYTGEDATVTLTLPLFRVDNKLRVPLPPPRPPRDRR